MYDIHEFMHLTTCPFQTGSVSKETSYLPSVLLHQKWIPTYLICYIICLYQLIRLITYINILLSVHLMLCHIAMHIASQQSVAISVHEEWIFFSYLLIRLAIHFALNRAIAVHSKWILDAMTCLLLWYKQFTLGCMYSISSS